MERSEETKNKIGKKLRETWKGMTDESFNARCQKAKDNWNEMTPEQKSKLYDASIKGTIKASKEGSFLEKHLFSLLIEQKFRTIPHKKHTIQGEQAHIDLFLPEEGIAIEIDGPSHIYPIYGDEALAKRMASDQKKNGLLLTDGYIVVRIKNHMRYISNTQINTLGEALVKLIKKLAFEQPKEIEKRYYELNLGDKRDN